MLEQLRAWLNGSREYFAGVILYAQVGNNEALRQLFAKGKTDYCYQRLQSELLRICQELKSKQNELPKDAGPSADANNDSDIRRTQPKTEGSIKTIGSSGGQFHKKMDGGVINPDLYTVCKEEADKSYKEVMNLRAELFAMARADDYTDPNTPDKVEQRSKLAVTVAERFKHVSELYNRLDYVKLHGRLPSDGEASEELNVDGLPEHLVKQTLDNTRKNFNKMKKRPVTPERIELLQKHEANIKKLEAKWLLLQPTK